MFLQKIIVIDNFSSDGTDHYLKNLNDNLNRILDNYHDDMFMRFAFRAKIFGNEERFVEFLQI